MGRVSRGQARALAVAAAVLVVGGLGYAAVRDSLSVTGAQAETQSQAAPLARICTTDRGVAVDAGADCDRALAIVRDGVDGKNGLDGKNGRGILGTSLRDGHLLVAFDDGTSQDVGPVVGAAGAVGPPGRSVSGVSLTGGRLVVAYSDGTSADLGVVVGPQGRGIASLDGSTGRLLVTLTDDSVVDLGPLPAGPPGKDGQNGAPAPSVDRQTFVQPDGSSRVCDRDGGPDNAPLFRCTSTAPTPTLDPTDIGG
jgi:hypothetical protein